MDEQRCMNEVSRLFGLPNGRSPLRGIREQENEDVSEITYRASNIYLTEEKNPIN